MRVQLLACSEASGGSMRLDALRNALQMFFCGALAIGLDGPVSRKQRPARRCQRRATALVSAPGFSHQGRPDPFFQVLNQEPRLHVRHFHPGSGLHNRTGNRDAFQKVGFARAKQMMPTPHQSQIGMEPGLSG